MKKKFRGPAPLEKFSGKNKKRNSLTGFTLIEIIMAVSILAIVGSAVSVFVINHMVAVTKRNQYSLAMNLARLEMEKVQNLAYASVTTLNTSNYLNYSLYVARTVNVIPPAGAEELKQVTVEVKKDVSSPSLVTLNTYIVKNVSFGL